MNPSAEKRKMSRMRVDFFARIFWGTAEHRSEVNIQNMSIHGISFRSKKYFTRGTSFYLILPNQNGDSARKEIQAEVVRCEMLNGFSSDGKFRIGAKFVFKTQGVTKPRETPPTETLAPLGIDNERLISHPMQMNKGGQSPSACRIRIREVYADLIQSTRTQAKEEIIYTRIQIKQVHLTASLSSSLPTMTFPEKPLAKTDNKPPFANLALNSRITKLS